MNRAVPTRYYEGMSQLVLRFFLIAVCAFTAAWAVTYLLMMQFPRHTIGSGLRFPLMFIPTSVLLILGSITLERAILFVRVERQRLYRRWLLITLGLGSLFMGMQTFALWSMFPEHRAPGDASMEATAFALALAALHALHFLIAVLSVSWITARSLSDRYDHEYYWGVRCCAWFWHGLGVIWMAILFVFTVASH
ncbi:MAG: hypothetical protein KDA58_06355 [Planctomycetaceae bacterium]|nr:hypothetical protein [Planctomycetaceae bacterium]